MALDIASQGGTPLTIIAGVPDGVADIVRQRLEKRYRRNDGHPSRLFRVLTGGKFGAYYSTHVIKSTLKFLFKYITQKRNTAEGAYNPAHVSLVYLMGEGPEAHYPVVDRFFIFCRCVGLAWPGKNWSEFTAAEIADYYARSIDSMATWHDEAASACFHLPVRNFYIAKDTLLSEQCLTRVRQNLRQLPIAAREILFNICKPKEKCPSCRTLKVRNPKDIRELCFVDGAKHGLPHDSDNKNIDEMTFMQSFLEALYRFGQPVAIGTQSDVQYPGKKTLGRTEFYCFPEGEYTSKNTSHVNVYTNDFVRFPKT